MKIQLLVGIFLLFSTCIYAQQADSLLSKTDRIVSLPNRLFSHVQKKSNTLNSSLDRQTEKYLQRLQRKEDGIYKGLQEVPGYRTVYPSIAPVAEGVGIGTIIYFIISEGSRLFPPRNLIPVP